MSAVYESPQDVEDAFYDALEEKDIAVMGEVWSEAEDSVCVHPLAPVIIGRKIILESWQHVFENSPQLSVTVHHRQWIEQGDLSVHIVDAMIGTGENGVPGALTTTNVYRKEAGGWKLLSHHASPPPMPGTQQ